MKIFKIPEAFSTVTVRANGAAEAAQKYLRTANTVFMKAGKTKIVTLWLGEKIMATICITADGKGGILTSETELI